MEPIQAGILSILPPVIAIALALITKEVFSSLIIGILSGTLIYSFSTGSGIVSAISSMFTIMGNEFSATMIIFLALLGALVAVITMAGGSNAYGEWASKKIKSREGAQLATCALGALIFIDDYFNCLTVGTVMKPVTDKNNISRAKLAYLIDATAAPVCIIAPISSWAASVISNFPETENMSGMQAFISSVPFNLYAILTILMIVVLSVTKLDFGPMARFEKMQWKITTCSPMKAVPVPAMNWRACLFRIKAAYLTWLSPSFRSSSSLFFACSTPAISLTAVLVYLKGLVTATLTCPWQWVVSVL